MNNFIFRQPEALHLRQVEEVVNVKNQMKVLLLLEVVEENVEAVVEDGGVQMIVMMIMIMFQTCLDLQDLLLCLTL